MNVHSTPLTNYIPMHPHNLELHSQVMCTHNAKAFQTHAHTNVHPCGPRQTCGNTFNYTICPSPPTVSHPTPMHIPHTSTVTPMFDLPLKLHQLHSTSVSELWSAIAARTPAEKYWGCSYTFMQLANDDHSQLATTAWDAVYLPCIFNYIII